MIHQIKCLGLVKMTSFFFDAIHWLALSLNSIAKMSL